MFEYIGINAGKLKCKGLNNRTQTMVNNLNGTQGVNRSFVFSGLSLENVDTDIIGKHT